MIENGSFPTFKVVGGIDLAGTNYNASNRTDPAVYTPMPDPDPLDENGFSTGQSKGEIRQDVSPGALRLYFCMIQGILDGMLLYPKEPFDLGNADELFEAYWDGIRANGTD